MADSKYGRLFTEADVTKLIRAAYELGYDDAQITGTVEGYDHAELATLVESDGPMTFPPDEPLFLLRASDGEQACDAVAQYGRSLSSSTREDVDRMAERVRVANAWDAMRMWCRAKRAG